MSNMLTFEELSKSLTKHGLYYNENELRLFYSTLLIAKGAFIRGPAGTGKTSLVETTAKIFDADFLYFQCYPNAREDEFLYKYEPDEKTKSGFTLREGILVEAVKRSIENPNKPVFLLIDELDKAHPSTDSFFLDFLQNKRVRWKNQILKANGNLYTFFTLNYERELSEPLLRRLPVIELSFPSTSVVRAILSKYTNNTEIINLALALYKYSIKAGLEKPATIQELIQFIQALQVLKGNVELNSLVYAYITKTDEQHEKLAKAISGKLDLKEETRSVITSIDIHVHTETDIRINKNKFTKTVSVMIDDCDLNNYYGIIEGDYAFDYAYTLLKNENFDVATNEHGNTIVLLKQSVDFKTFYSFLKSKAYQVKSQIYNSSLTGEIECHMEIPYKEFSTKISGSEYIVLYKFINNQELILQFESKFNPILARYDKTQNKLEMLIKINNALNSIETSVLKDLLT